MRSIGRLQLLSKRQFLSNRICMNGSKTASFSSLGFKNPSQNFSSNVATSSTLNTKLGVEIIHWIANWMSRNGPIILLLFNTFDSNITNLWMNRFLFSAPVFSFENFFSPLCPNLARVWFIYNRKKKKKSQPANAFENESFWHSAWKVRLNSIRWVSPVRK